MLGKIVSFCRQWQSKSYLFTFFNEWTILRVVLLTQHFYQKKKNSKWPLRFFSTCYGKLLKVCKKVMCNDPRKSASHICAIPQKDQSQLRLLIIVNKVQIYPINTRCGTYHTPTHISQSIKLEHHNIPHLNP